MPDFTVRGNPGAIRSRSTTTTEKGQSFFVTGEALSKIDVSGWTGRAADHFREAHDLEPDRWIEAGNGFVRAGNALMVYASAVERAQELAQWAEGEYARGEQVTQDARAAYDADVARGRDQQARSIAHGIPFDLTIVPFDDPGQAIRDNALAELARARSELDAAAHTCAAEVRAGCTAAPEKPNWFESGLRFVGGIFEGAGEAVWDLLTISPFGLVNMVDDSWKLLRGDLTPEELMDKYKLSLETAEGMWDAMRHDPLEFGKNLGKGLLDWDTWSDDPARALGHLVPDAVIAALTAGTGGVAARGAHAGADGMEALTDMRRADEALDGLGHLHDLDAARHLDGLGAAARLDHLPDHLHDLVHTPIDQLTPHQVHDLVEARNAVTVEAGTPMQRVITPQQAQDYLRGFSDTDPRFQPDQTFGYTARSEDVAQLRTPQDLFDGLGLDYDTTPYRVEGDLLGPNRGGTAVDEMHVLRYDTRAADDVIVPRHHDLGGDGSFDAAALDPENPFTGNGYTSGGIPEFRTAGPSALESGAEIWRIDGSGHQQLVAVLRSDLTWGAAP